MALAAQRLEREGLWIDEIRLGSPEPLAAVHDATNFGSFDEIIVCTLPRRVSRRLKHCLPHGVSAWQMLCLPHRVARATGLPVTHVVARPGAARALPVQPALEPIAA